MGFDWSYNWNLGCFNMPAKWVAAYISYIQQELVSANCCSVEQPTWSMRAMLASKKDFMVPMSSQYPLKRYACNETLVISIKLENYNSIYPNTKISQWQCVYKNTRIILTCTLKSFTAIGMTSDPKSFAFG